MKIIILNGEMPHHDQSFTKQIQQQMLSLGEQHDVVHIKLQDLKLQICKGCWSCWYKTPGYCPVKDDSELILRQIISSDLIVFASPLIAGFTTSLLKTITDKFVTLIHPYVIILNKEYHHLKRYQIYPKIGVYLQKEKDTDAEDIAIVHNVYQRMTLNFHTSLNFVATTEKSLYECIEKKETPTSKALDKKVLTKEESN